MQTAEEQARGVLDHMHEEIGRLARHDAGAAHAAIEFEKDSQVHIMLLRGRGQGADGRLVIGDAGELCLRVLQRQFGKAVPIGAHAWHGQHHIRRAAHRAHFHLGDGGAFKLGDSQLDLALDERQQLVCFHMRTQPPGPAGDLDHQLQIVLDPLTIEQQGRGGDFAFVFDVEPGVCEHVKIWVGR